MTMTSSGTKPRLPTTAPSTASVFKDVFAVEGYDDSEANGEDRFTIIGMAEGVLLFVVYTPRVHRLRLISARRATKHEQGDYYQQNA
jgi:uncharacterized DUF497 family protein